MSAKRSGHYIMANPRVRALFDDIQASREAAVVKLAGMPKAPALDRLTGEMLHEALSAECHYCICAQAALVRKAR